MNTKWYTLVAPVRGVRDQAGTTGLPLIVVTPRWRSEHRVGITGRSFQLILST